MQSINLLSCPRPRQSDLGYPQPKGGSKFKFILSFYIKKFFFKAIAPSDGGQPDLVKGKHKNLGHRHTNLFKKNFKNIIF